MDKIRHNELKKKRKARLKRKRQQMKNLNAALSESKYMFREYLVNCDDALALMEPADGRIYRLVHNPHLEIDIYPTSLWDYDSLTPKRMEEKQTISAGSSLEDQQEQLREYTPSFNISSEGAVKPFLGRLKKMKTFQQFSHFKNTKGSHIFAYDVTPKDGMMWAEPDGHVSFLPYENFALAEHVALDFTPVPIEKYCENINSNTKK